MDGFRRREKEFHSLLIKKVPDDLFWRVKNAKTSIRASTWKDFLEKICELVEENKK